MTDDTAPEWVTRAEAAGILDVSISSIDKYMAAEKLTKYRDGRGRVWLDRAEVDALLKRLPVSASPVQ